LAFDWPTQMKIPDCYQPSSVFCRSVTY